MKKTLSFLFALIAFVCSAQTFINNSTPTTSAAYGTYFVDTYNRASLGSSYSTGGTITTTITGNKLNISGGTATFTNYVYYNNGLGTLGALQNENYTSSVIIETSVDGLGIWLGSHSLSTYMPTDYSAFINLFNNGSRGFVSIWVNGTSKATSGSALTYTTGDRIYFSLTRTNITYTMKAYNITHPVVTPVTLSYSVQPISGSTNQNVGFPAIGLYGGTGGACNIIEWKYQINAYKNAKYAFTGHSIVVGCISSDYTTRFANVSMTALGYNSTQYNVLASQGALVTEGINSINELLLLKPTKVIVMYGTNEVSTNQTLATFTANYHSYCAQLRTAGIGIVHCLIPPQGGSYTANVPTFNTAIQSEANTSGESYLDFYSQFVSTGTAPNASLFDADLIHFNSTGHGVAARIIETYLFYNP